MSIYSTALFICIYSCVLVCLHYSTFKTETEIFILHREERILKKSMHSACGLCLWTLEKRLKNLYSCCCVVQPIQEVCPPVLMMKMYFLCPTLNNEKTKVDVIWFGFWIFTFGSQIVSVDFWLLSRAVYTHETKHIYFILCVYSWPKSTGTFSVSASAGIKW